MSGQIRTWDKREETIDDSTMSVPEDVSVVRLDDPETVVVDRLELILQLRELQEDDPS